MCAWFEFSVCISPDCNANVPVRMPFVNMHISRSDWITRSSEVRPGLLAARTLLADNDQYAAIRFMNVSGVEQSLRGSHSLGVASPCDPTLIDSWSGDVANSQHAGGDNEVATSGAVGNTCGLTHAATGGPDNDTPTEGVRVCLINNNGPRPDANVDCAHVQSIIDKLPDTLTAELRQQAIALICRNADVFFKHEFDVGCTDLLIARIQTNGHRLIAEPLRRHARVHLDVIDETIDRIKAAGIVDDAVNPWSANQVVVAKKDELGRPITPRVTIDFRQLNAITYRDKFPLPHIKDCLRTLDRARFIISGRPL